MKRFARMCLLAVGAGLGLAILGGGKQVSAAAGTCQDVQLPVALGQGLPANKTLAGTLCTPKEWAPGERRVDVLVHGGTYNKMYWDWPVDSPKYSYVNRTLQSGRATFAYDKLGSGDSSRPLSLLVTLDAQANALHESVQWLRGNGYEQVTVVGHSQGSLTAVYAAGKYPSDANRLVMTGALHAPGAGFPFVVGSSYPAALDPQFAGQGYDLGYMTTMPGARSLFYSSNADPAVIAFDEAHKDVASNVEFDTAALNFFLPPLLNMARHVTAPVLVIAGQQDQVVCGLIVDCSNQAAVLANEAPYYSSAASLTAVTIPNTGHNMSLHPAADESFAAIDEWIREH